MAMVDTRSPTWRAVKQVADEAHAQAIAELSGFGINNDRSNYLRGKIDAMRDIIELETAEPEAEQPPAPTIEGYSIDI